jgi:hypothetical protein
VGFSKQDKRLFTAGMKYARKLSKGLVKNVKLLGSRSEILWKVLVDCRVELPVRFVTKYDSLMTKNAPEYFNLLAPEFYI